MSEIDVVIAVILGVFQGGMEWLPISSSGQTILAMVDILNIDADTAISFAFYLHFGTMIAVILRLKKDVKHIILRFPKYKEDKMVKFIILSTIATALIGIPIYLLLRDFFGRDYGGEAITALVGLFLIITGIILHISKKKMGTKGLKDSNAIDSIFAGIGQGFAVIPGLSRSGITVAALISKNFNQEEALHLSFLMSIPATIFIIILESTRETMTSIGIFPIAVGIITSFIVGYVMIDVLLRFAKKVKFDVFCIVFGIIAIIVVAIILP